MDDPYLPDDFGPGSSEPFDSAGPDGDFTPSNGYPEHRFPGIPGLTGSSDSLVSEFTMYVEVPTNGT